MIFLVSCIPAKIMLKSVLYNFNNFQKHNKTYINNEAVLIDDSLNRIKAQIPQF